MAARSPRCQLFCGDGSTALGDELVREADSGRNVRKALTQLLERGFTLFTYEDFVLRGLFHGLPIMP